MVILPNSLNVFSESGELNALDSCHLNHAPDGALIVSATKKRYANLPGSPVWQAESLNEQIVSLPEWINAGDECKRQRLIFGRPRYGGVVSYVEWIANDFGAGERRGKHQACHLEICVRDEESCGCSLPGRRESVHFLVAWPPAFRNTLADDAVFAA